MNNIQKWYKKLLKTKSKKELIERLMDYTDAYTNLSVQYKELYDWIVNLQKMVEDGEITI